MTRADRKRVTQSFALLACLFVFILTVLGFVIQRNHQLAAEGAQAHHVLCVVKSDYRQRLLDGEQFLRDHPNGIPGIPKAVIQNSVFNQRRTYEAMGSLSCPG